MELGQGSKIKKHNKGKSSTTLNLFSNANLKDPISLGVEVASSISYAKIIPKRRN